eukprot:3670118-Pleurochrysis_carterae.AAC.1
MNLEGFAQDEEMEEEGGVQAFLDAAAAEFCSTANATLGDTAPAAPVAPISAEERKAAAVKE